LKNRKIYHIPVLLQDAIDALNIQEGGKYIDGTLGGGGHAKLILERGGVVLGIDQDSDAIDECREEFKDRKNIIVAQGNFMNIKKIAGDYDFIPCSGILLDLGTSVHQIKESERGFTFMKHEFLDMRMDKGKGLSAFDIVNKWPKEELIRIFGEYGEESDSGIIAETIVKRRKKQEIVYSDELAGIISKIKNRREKDIHPATKVFQALRIAVNDELNTLKRGIEESMEVLGSGGRLTIISFHSLEDRIVKQAFLKLEREKMGRVITKKPITAGKSEIEKNRKARSAKLRVFEKN